MYKETAETRSAVSSMSSLLNSVSDPDPFHFMIRILVAKNQQKSAKIHIKINPPKSQEYIFLGNEIKITLLLDAHK